MTRPARSAAVKSAPRETTAARRRREAAESIKPAPRKRAPKSPPVETVPASGPRPETLAFAKKVVELRDKKGLAWAEVASAVGVEYGHNGSSRLRRAYALGNGATNGVRAQRAAEAAAKAEAAKPKRAPRKPRAAK
jgi:hypothetical protein